ncbi:hypothetical protein [Herbiconiux sp. VKM Ac-2851]|uniref:hypothetical protein n=1 Tax=Herbiconiux sp. VKM Ac-2851 TaxID=2739025 RepID=UPI00156622A0|nr:hypothetical protein [Herbiconiux sp. VKM Ac-2851]NQX34238.1 hypothetical protein [Herbiconiux sp. VKM Ac-2851]
MTDASTPAPETAPDGTEPDEHPELADGTAVPDQLTDEPTITPPVGAPGALDGSVADA